MTNLFDRAKLLFRKDKELCLSLYRILGFYPHNIELYRIALAHKSSHYVSNEKGRPLNNERLEFLGDAILEAVTSDIIFHRYERKREGFLTTTRSKLVQRDTLNRLAHETGLDTLLKKNTTGRTHNNYLGGNAFEALVGAVYLDRGYRHCHWFVSNRIIGKLVDLDDMARKEVNFKSKLLEWSQKNRIQLEFKLDESIDTTGNSPEFRSYAILEGITAGEGKGFSKKESHQQAAKEALLKLRREPQFIDRILRSKEKRTAMEADMFTAVPEIDEIENELKTDKRATAGSTVDGRPAKPVKRRTRSEARRAAARTETAPAAATADNAARGKAEASRRSDSAPRDKAEAPRRSDNAPKDKAEAARRSDSAPRDKAEAARRSDNAPRDKAEAPRRSDSATTPAATADATDTTPGAKTDATKRPAEQSEAPRRAAEPRTPASEAGESAAAPQPRSEAPRSRRQTADAATDAQAPEAPHPIDGAGEGPARSAASRRRRRRPATAATSRFDREEDSRAAADHEAIIRAAEEAAFKEQAL